MLFFKQPSKARWLISNLSLTNMPISMLVTTAAILLSTLRQ